MSWLPTGSLAPRDAAPPTTAEISLLRPLRPERASAALTALAAFLWLLFLGAQLGGFVGPAHHPALAKWATKAQSLQRASGTPKGWGSVRGEGVASAIAGAPPLRSALLDFRLDLAPAPTPRPAGIVDLARGAEPSAPRPAVAVVARFARPPAHAPPFLA